MNLRHTIQFLKITLVAAMLLPWGSACKEKYSPDVHYPHTGYLVVNGSIDGSGQLSQFRLSKTTTLDSAYFVPVTGASLSIDQENGSSYPLYETGNGEYEGYGFLSGQGSRARLHILTADAREYYSDYSEFRITPPVDSVTWQEKNNGVQIFVSAHDPRDSTRYYRWRFDETWKYTAKYFSSLVWDPDAAYSFRYRTSDELLYTCWKSDTSSNILLGSTAKLASDVLAVQQVTFIPYSETFNKLFYRYSINVYLEALTIDEYNWYDRLRKNTESLGSIFDAQPSELTGNIHSVTDPTETIIGWVGCHSVTQSRIFIGRGDLPSHPFLDDGYSNCQPDTLLFGQDDQRIHDAYSAGNYVLPVSFYIKKGSLNPAGIIGTADECADCRLRGGVLMRPDFWMD